MDSDPSSRLAEDLLLLGRDRDPSSRVDDALVTAVMTRLAADPMPRRGWRAFSASAGESLRRRRRQALIALTVIVISLLGVPAVRAAVAEWFGFDGVRVEIRPVPGPPGTPSPPPAARSGLSLPEAAALIAFRPVVPSKLGPPDGVEVSDDRRVLSLSWDDVAGGTGTVRLDEFDGRLDYAFAKTAVGVKWLTIDDAPALWFDQPHEVSVLDSAGTPRVEKPRLAGRTLIWESGGTTLRLEGDLEQDQAVEIARSTEPQA